VFRYRKSLGILCAALLHTPALADQAVAPPTPAAETQNQNRTKEILTDAAIVATLVAASIAAYRAGGPGPCACPDDRDRRGHRCGKRSAHSRAGGWTVYCSARDITAEMISAYRRQHGN